MAVIPRIVMAVSAVTMAAAGTAICLKHIPAIGVPFIGMALVTALLGVLLP